MSKEEREALKCQWCGTISNVLLKVKDGLARTERWVCSICIVKDGMRKLI